MRISGRPIQEPRPTSLETCRCQEFLVYFFFREPQPQYPEPYPWRLCQTQANSFCGTALQNTKPNNRLPSQFQPGESTTRRIHSHPCFCGAWNDRKTQTQDTKKRDDPPSIKHGYLPECSTAEPSPRENHRHHQWNCWDKYVGDRRSFGTERLICPNKTKHTRTIVRPELCYPHTRARVAPAVAYKRKREWTLRGAKHLYRSGLYDTGQSRTILHCWGPDQLCRIRNNLFCRRYC